MSSSISVWTENKSGKRTKIAVDRTLWIGQTNSILGKKAPGAAVAVRPIQPRSGYIAVAIVGDAFDNLVAVNGMLLWAGMHTLKHADRLDVGRNTVWLAANANVNPVDFDPAIHGDDVFCFISKSRLAAGDPIIICPGHSGRHCGQIYAKKSWESAMQHSQLRCAHCGFDPTTAEWSPPKPSSSRTIDDIIKSLTNAA